MRLNPWCDFSGDGSVRQRVAVQSALAPLAISFLPVDHVLIAVRLGSRRDLGERRPSVRFSQGNGSRDFTSRDRSQPLLFLLVGAERRHGSTANRRSVQRDADGRVRPTELLGHKTLLDERRVLPAVRLVER